MIELTSRQQDVFNWICKFKSEMNYCPTVTETGKAFGITEQGMQRNITALTKKGFISVTPKISRSIVILKENKDDDFDYDYLKSIDAI